MRGYAREFSLKYSSTCRVSFFHHLVKNESIDVVTSKVFNNWFNFRNLSYNPVSIVASILNLCELLEVHMSMYYLLNKICRNLQISCSHTENECYVAVRVNVQFRAHTLPRQQLVHQLARLEYHQME